LIGYQVLMQACAQAKAWAMLLPDAPMFMNVNLSPRQIRDPKLTSYVAECLQSSGIEPNRLQLEITETVLLEDSYPTMAKLHELKQLGVRLTIDDFGTGYSSLSYLHQFPVDGVKIAKPFIDNVAEGGEQSALARAIIGLGQTLHLEVVAEGIERVEQMDTLRELGCELGQGYYPCRPSEPGALTARLLQGDLARGSTLLKVTP
jgi:EAL domain-containing protein (putative c-di-GMP-specific phosphodiesterase class I)